MECGRPASSDSPEGRICQICLTEAEWENIHSDNGHEGIESLTKAETNFKTVKAFNAFVAETKAETEQCWVCHPELNEAKKAYTPRTGTSREGIRLTVPPKADPKTKALTVAEKIEGQYFEKGSVKVRTVKGVTTLTAGDVKLVWDVRGRFVSAGSLVNGKKVRNVSEALRVLGS
jgi:hypothetical protein